MLIVAEAGLDFCLNRKFRRMEPLRVIQIPGVRACLMGPLVLVSFF